MALFPQAPPLLWRHAGALGVPASAPPVAFPPDSSDPEQPGAPAAPSTAAARGCFWQVGVGPLSTRAPAGVTFSPAVVADVRRVPPGKRPVVALDHAGPAGFAFSLQRARGATDAVDARSGRHPAPLSSAEWHALAAAMQDAATMLRAAELDVGLVCDDDGLLHHALSPRSGLDPARGRALFVACLAAVQPTWLALPADDLTPGGLDATACLALAEIAVAHGASCLLASAGTQALPPLQRRQKGKLAVDARLFLVPAIDLARRLRGGAQVWGVVPAVGVSEP